MADGPRPPLGQGIAPASAGMDPEKGPARPVRNGRRGLEGWLDPRGRHVGGWAFALNRITGLGLVFYLYLHLGVLSLLARGPSAWDAFIAVALSPLFLALDVILIAGVLIHGLNGIRLVLLGLGVVTGRQRALFVILMGIAAVGVVAAAVRIFTMG